MDDHRLFDYCSLDSDTVSPLDPQRVARDGRCRARPPGNQARKKPNQTPQPNQYGCLDVGDPCKRASQCCSSICKGKPGKKTCRAHDESICTPRRNICTTGVAALCNGSNVSAACVLTTGKTAFCGDFTSGADQHCQRCSRDGGLPRGGRARRGLRRPGRHLQGHLR